jgi:hypothetical protein
LEDNADSSALIYILIKAFFFAWSDGEGQGLGQSHNSEEYNATR